jgi:hypothetical protein
MEAINSKRKRQMEAAPNPSSLCWSFKAVSASAVKSLVSKLNLDNVENFDYSADVDVQRTPTGGSIEVTNYIGGVLFKTPLRISEVIAFGAGIRWFPVDDYGEEQEVPEPRLSSIKEESPSADKVDLTMD